MSFLLHIRIIFFKRKTCDLQNVANLEGYIIQVARKRTDVDWLVGPIILRNHNDYDNDDPKLWRILTKGDWRRI